MITYYRRIPIRSLSSWRKVDKMYSCMRLYNIVYMKWLNYLLGPLILSIGSGIVFMFYVSIRPSCIPMFLHFGVPFLAFGSILILSWLWYDVILMKRVGEEVREKLHSKTHKFLWELEPAERMYVFRKSASLRPAAFTIGQFSDMTLEGLVGVWDEILNQLLFLLSL